MASIGQRRHDSVHDLYPGFRLAQQQRAPITGGPAAVKIRFDLAARDACKRQSILRAFHGGVLSKLVVVCEQP